MVELTGYADAHHRTHVEQAATDRYPGLEPVGFIESLEARPAAR